MSLPTEVPCSRAGCSRQVVTSLRSEDFCFDHFCSRCYELLERSEFRELPLSEKCREEFVALDECARRALELSFGRVQLNNLDRARLLDILLWAGDLTSTLQHRRTAAPLFSSLRDARIAAAK
jgi:hypothetical protein